MSLPEPSAPTPAAAAAMPPWKNQRLELLALEGFTIRL
jgi:hypothetical protein